MLRESQEIELVGDIYEAAFEPSRWTKALEGLASLVRSQGAAITLGDREGGRIGYAVGHSEEGRIDYDSYFNQQDPLIAAGIDAPAGVWLNDWHIVGPAFGRTAYYNEFFRRHGWHACGALILANEQGRWASTSFQRAQGAQAFDPEDEARLRRFLPHLQRAYRLQEETDFLRQRTSVHEAALQASEIAVWHLDAHGRLRFANALAEKALADQSGIFVGHGRLRLRVAPEQLEAALRAACAKQGARPTWILAGDAQVFTVMPFRAPDGEPTALVLQRLRSARRPALAELLRSVYRLTAREAEVAQRLGDGLSPKQIAQGMDLQVDTVRTHVRSIYAKMGARRQAELARIIAGLTASP